MIDALLIAGSGMKSQESYIDVISNNIANVNTTGYKRAQVSFVDLVNSGKISSEQPVDINVIQRLTGGGSKLQGVRHIFGTGELKLTDNPMDIAIAGHGFLEVELADGSYAYTKAGHLSVDEQGTLTTATGYRLSANIDIPADTSSLKIDSDGVVKAQLPNEPGMVELGQLELATFSSVDNLQAIGSGLYQAGEENGSPIYGQPGQDGFGEIKQGFVEVSNVSMVNEMVSLLMAQRAYQLNARVVQTADQLLETANNLSR